MGTRAALGAMAEHGQAVPRRAHSGPRGARLSFRPLSYLRTVRSLAKALRGPNPASLTGRLPLLPLKTNTLPQAGACPACAFCSEPGASGGHAPPHGLCFKRWHLLLGPVVSKWCQAQAVSAHPPGSAGPTAEGRGDGGRPALPRPAHRTSPVTQGSGSSSHLGPPTLYSDILKPQRGSMRLNLL